MIQAGFEQGIGIGQMAQIEDEELLPSSRDGLLGALDPPPHTLSIDAASKSNINGSDVHHEIEERLTAFRSFHDRALRGMEMIWGGHYTAAEIAAMKRQKMTPIKMNYLRQAVRSLVRYYTANNPSFDVVAMEGGDEQMASVFGFLLRRMFHISRGNMQMQRAVKWLIGSGQTTIVPYWDALAERGRGDLKFRHWPTHQSLPDPYSQDPLYTDTDLWLLFQYVTPQQAMRHYPHLAQELQYVASVPDVSRPGSNWTTHEGVPFQENQNASMLRQSQAFRRTWAPLYVLHTPYDTFEFNMPPDTIPWALQLLQQQMARIEVQSQNIYETSVFLDRLQVSPWMKLYTDTCPVVSTSYEDTGGYEPMSNTQPMGEPEFVHEVVRTLNKAMSTVMLHAQQTANPRIAYPTGSLQGAQNAQMDKARQMFSAPGSHLPFNGQTPPITLSPTPMNEAFYGIYLEMAKFLRETTGSDVFLHDARAAETWHGYLAQLENAREQVGDVTDRIEAMLVQLGSASVQMMQQYYAGQPRTFRMMNDRVAKERQVRVNDVTAIGPGIIGKLLDVSQGRYDVQVVGGSYAPTQRTAKLSAMLELAREGIVDGTEVRKLAPIENPQEIEQRMGEVQKMQHLLEAYERDLSQKNILLRQFLKQVMEADRMIAKVQLTGEKNVELEKFRAKLALMAAEAEQELEKEGAEG